MSVTYTAGEVTAALLQLVANDGNVRKTSEELIDDGFQVPESTLRLWKNDTHREQYLRLEQEHGKNLEREAVNIAQARMLRAANLEERVLQKIEDALDDGKLDVRDLPQTLRALTDTKGKTTDQLLKLTGRPTAPKDPGGNDLVQLVLGMVDRGLVRAAAGVELRPPLPAAEQDVGERDDQSGRDGDRKRLNP